MNTHPYVRALRSSQDVCWMIGRLARRALRFPRVVGAVALLVVMIVAGTYIEVLVQRARVLDAQSKAFVDNAMLAFAANWNGQELLDRSTPALRAHIESKDLPVLADVSSHLGPFGQYLGATGAVSWLSLAGFEDSLSASYVAKASFMNGTATFRFTVVKPGDRWVINEYHIDAVLLDALGAGLLGSSPLERNP
jgi:fermentation-respiration switch protein FrsA (DUF1100 family)